MSLLPILSGNKYTIPDQMVASQLLMYRQLLHTECKPGLRLSRGFQGTKAQTAVMHMPWWEKGVEQTKRMVISYDNLIVRLWLSGAIMPYVDGGYASAHSSLTLPKDEEPNDPSITKYSDLLTNSPLELKIDLKTTQSHINTLIDERGLPPIPHSYWVDRLGFQQTDPITDFRSGGVLALAMLVYLVEACPEVHARFLPSGDTHMLPYGITCINVTDMIARFCMFSKSIDKIDALLSQKPFWRLFADPNALLVLQELSIDMLCDVVVDMGTERSIIRETTANNTGCGVLSQEYKDVSVFDFSEILSRTEKRVHDDLLGSGPKTVSEMRAIHRRLSIKYERDMEKIKRNAYKYRYKPHAFMQEGTGGMGNKSILNVGNFLSNIKPLRATISMTGNVINSAEGMWNKYKPKIHVHNMPQVRDLKDSNKKVTNEEIEFMTQIPNIKKADGSIRFVEKETKKSSVWSDSKTKSSDVNSDISFDCPELQNINKTSSLYSNNCLNETRNCTVTSTDFPHSDFMIEENDIDDII